MTQIFFAATQYAAATITAAVKAGLFGSREGRRRVLVISNTSAIPELTTPVDRMAGFEKLRPEYDAVYSWNEMIAPHHPAGWSPLPEEIPVWERALRLAWELGDGPVEIACESIQANPSRAVADIFADSPIHVYADGLMSYGPTRNRMPADLHNRFRRLLHLDLVPGLRPLLLSEYGVEPVVIPGDTFQQVLEDIGGHGVSLLKELVPADDRPTAVLLGQYLSALELITVAEEDALHVRMLRGAVAAGHRHLLFKPHPSAPAQYSRSLEQAAAELGVALTVLDTPLLAETVYQYLRPGLVVGCFSTALMTASAFYGIPVARVGTEELLKRLTPYENSNRVPLTVIDAVLPDLEKDAAAIGTPLHRDPERVGSELAPLVRAVGYCMQPKAYAALKGEAAAWLDGHLAENARYFSEKRLTRLGLPGGNPSRADTLRRNPAVRRLVRGLRAARR
ncbi:MULTISPECIES: polysialyltransferase family glycosyltransferase [unclassified Streptomyces]|uniref:polysialyltransferase family glycosyltransferase n=1 Tax=unclassified Streptomyces TaxID=2593676 RepID=UPI0038153349